MRNMSCQDEEHGLTGLGRYPDSVKNIFPEGEEYVLPG
jgi:hypothetical protein